jgi:pimeloyl-ACP methyl ester carboxylesterase
MSEAGLNPPDKSKMKIESLMKEGLALYRLGEGEPVLFMPYPHGFTTESTSESALAGVLADLGRQVITFDPSGAFRSSRPADVSLEDMLGSALAVLGAFQIQKPVDVIGHSMGGLCALALAVEHPERVKRLALVGSLSGGPSVQRNKGLPWHWRVWEPDFWRFIYWGLQLGSGKGNLAMHKALTQLIRNVSYADRRLSPKIPISLGDRSRPAPVRDSWPMKARRIDYGPSLVKVRSPALMCVGRHDPQAPPACSQELADGIHGSRLVVFENSGHYPFVEERELFLKILAQFYSERD